MVRKKVRVKVKSGTKVLRKPITQMYTPREKLQNCLWVFKLGDPDDKPSIPHAHAEEFGYRLDAWTGDIYPAGNERERTIGHLTKKELQKLHSDRRFVQFAKKQIEWYRTAYPDVNFFVPDWLERKMLRISSNSANNKIEILIFSAKAVINGTKTTFNEQIAHKTTKSPY